MPKIPTFRTEATITGEVGSVQSNTQMSLNQTIGNVLAPVTKEIVQHRVKQKDFEIEKKNKKMIVKSEIKNGYFPLNLLLAIRTLSLKLLGSPIK